MECSHKLLWRMNFLLPCIFTVKGNILDPVNSLSFTKSTTALCEHKICCFLSVHLYIIPDNASYILRLVSHVRNNSIQSFHGYNHLHIVCSNFNHNICYIINQISFSWVLIATLLIELQFWALVGILLPTEF